MFSSTSKLWSLCFARNSKNSLPFLLATSTRTTLHTSIDAPAIPSLPPSLRAPSRVVGGGGGGGGLYTHHLQEHRSPQTLRSAHTSANHAMPAFYSIPHLLPLPPSLYPRNTESTFSAAIPSLLLASPSLFYTNALSQGAVAVVGASLTPFPTSSLLTLEAPTRSVVVRSDLCELRDRHQHERAHLVVTLKNGRVVRQRVDLPDNALVFAKDHPRPVILLGRDGVQGILAEPHIVLDGCWVLGRARKELRVSERLHRIRECTRMPRVQGARVRVTYAGAWVPIQVCTNASPLRRCSTTFDSKVPYRTQYGFGKPRWRSSLYAFLFIAPLVRPHASNITRQQQHVYNVRIPLR